MDDIRENILDKSFHDAGMEDASRELTTKPFRVVVNAMDEYFTERGLELLTYVVKNTTGHSIDEEGNVEFKYKGEWISAKQLFENFL